MKREKPKPKIVKNKTQIIQDSDKHSIRFFSRL